MSNLATRDGLLVLNGSSTPPPVASPDVAGVVKPGPDFTVGPDGTLSIADAYDPVTVYDGRPAVGGRPGQDHIDPATGDLWSYEKTNENEPAAQAK